MEEMTFERLAHIKHLEKQRADLLAEVNRLRNALHIEQQIVEAFYQYRMECCFDHCEEWMVEHGYRVIVLEDEDDPTSGVTEWACEVMKNEQ